MGHKKELDEKAIIHQYEKWKSISAVSRINNTTDVRVREVLARHGIPVIKKYSPWREEGNFWEEVCIRCHRSRSEMRQKGFSINWVKENFIKGMCRSCRNTIFAKNKHESNNN